VQLYRLKIEPLSAWRTPWHADTLSGMLCWMCARRDGGQRLRDEILEPALAGRPPFVLSDLCPGNLLPAPAIIQRYEWPPLFRKLVRRAKWITPAGFRMVQRCEPPDVRMLSRDGGIRSHAELHRSIGRASGSTAGGGQVFVTESNYLEQDVGTLSLYVRTTETYASRLLSLVEELSLTGYGAGASTGKGHFQLASELEPMPQFDAIEKPVGRIVLSTFQPAAGDPVEGYWDSFVKFGKLGPDFGLANVHKRPLVMLRPGAMFVAPGASNFVGRAVPTTELLSEDTINRLSDHTAQPVQLAFGLTVPVGRAASAPS
jgi:hypothetical protein